MAGDHTTEVLLAGIRADVRAVAQEAPKAAAAAAEKLLKTALEARLKTLDEKIEFLERARTFEPIVVAILIQAGLLLAAYLAGWLVCAAGLPFWGFKF